MNQIEHLLYLRSPTGEFLTILSGRLLLSLTYTLKENEPGILEFDLPGDFDITLLKIDGQIEIYRSFGGSPILQGDTGWFIRDFVRQTSIDKVKSIHVTAFSAMDLLRRRIIPYIAGSSYSEKVGMPWDDMLREIVYENYGPGASYAGASYGDDPARNLEPWLITESFKHYGASFPTTHAFSWRVVFNALVDIINEVQAQGIYCTIDIVWIAPANYEFRVFIGPRGTDHSRGTAYPVIVSEEHRNLTVPKLDENWQEEHNFIYAAGQGQEADRIVRTAQDDKRIKISPFNRQEFLSDARNVYLPDAVQNQADAALEAGRPKRSFAGSIIQTEGSIYGVQTRDPTG